jgi:murein L,D-transpeptidase YcbB/YkuD
MSRPVALFCRPIALFALLMLPLAGARAQDAAPELVAAAAVASPADRLAAIDAGTLDPKSRAAVAASLARWQALGPLPEGRWLMVNIPAYRIDLYEGAARLGSWRAILGKPKTPTPTFKGEARGVILNPWWEVPASIVAESVGRLVARNPKRAAAQGYVREGSRYAQAPGPANQLGRMKLDFRNAHSVGIHDTPSKPLFEREKRAFSHGCIRVDDPMSFAATLLGPPASRDSLQAFVDTSRETKTLPFAQPIPVIVTYMTAEVGDDGALVVHDDIYRKDAQALSAWTGAARSGASANECFVG